jgi:penicillin-binding protein 1C
MSAESASEILSILSGSPPPPGRMPARLTLGAPVVAYKTGTSYGFRDAWAAGIGAGYVVVIWIGRADGAPRAGATGRDAALPVLFESFDMIGRSLPDEAPSQIATIDQTADSIRTAPPLRHFGSPDKAPPHILFPPDGAELWFDSEHASFILSAQSRRAIRWYVDGQAIAPTKTGQAVWRPLHEGFYDIQAIDDAGTPSTSRVRLRSRPDP